MVYYDADEMMMRSSHFNALREHLPQENDWRMSEKLLFHLYVRIHQPIGMENSSNPCYYIMYAYANIKLLRALNILLNIYTYTI